MVGPPVRLAHIMPRLGRARGGRRRRAERPASSRQDPRPRGDGARAWESAACGGPPTAGRRRPTPSRMPTAPAPPSSCTRALIENYRSLRERLLAGGKGCVGRQEPLSSEHGLSGLIGDARQPDPCTTLLSPRRDAGWRCDAHAGLTRAEILASTTRQHVSRSAGRNASGNPHALSRRGEGTFPIRAPPS